MPDLKSDPERNGPPATTRGRRRFLQGSAALGGGLLGLRPTRPARAATTEIRLLNVESDPKAVAFLKGLSADYEAATGVRLIVDTIVGTTLWTKLTTAIKTGKPYDLITCTQASQLVLMAQNEMIVPLTGLIDDIGRADFDPPSLVFHKNDILWLPYNYNLCCMYYRKDWLEDARLSVPTNWADYAQVAKAFTDSAKRRFGTTLTYSAGLTPWNNTGFLWASGVKFYDDSWNVLIDTPAIKPRLARTLEFLDAINPCNAPGQFSATLVSMATNFTSDVAGIIAASGSLVEAIERQMPDPANKFVIGPYPAPDGGKGTVTLGGKGFAVGKTANSNATIDLLRWMIKSDKMTDFLLTRPTYNQPVQYSTYKNPRWLANPTVKKYWTAMQTMQGFLDKNTTDIDAIQLQGNPLTINQGLLLNSEVILQMYQNVLSKKMTVAQAIDDCATQMRKFTRKDA